MALIPGRTFDTLAADDLKPLAPPLDLKSVREIRRTPTSLMARVADSTGKVTRVTITTDSEELTESECSACAAVACVHVSSALHAWIGHRGKVQNAKRMSRVDRALEKPAWIDGDLMATYFHGCAKVALEVDLKGNGPALEVKLSSGDREARISIPPADAPSYLWNLPAAVKKSDRVKALRVAEKPITPEIRADYDADGRLQLAPVYTLGSKSLDHAAIEKGLAGTQWFFDGRTYHPLGRVPTGLKEHFARGKRTIEGDAIPEFITGEFETLCNHVAFRPSEAVKQTQVVSKPKLSAIHVETGAGDWMELDPVYQAGDVRVALHEILAMQKPKGYLRKGNQFVMVDKQAMRDELGAAGTMGPDGRMRMRKAEYVLKRAEFKVAIEAGEGVKKFEADLERISNPKPDPIPKGLLTQLRPYQKSGYDWMRFLKRAGLHGVLADDMGLGKTHQCMAFLLSLYEEGAKRPSLVVCPTSVLDPWMDKMRQFAPGLRPYKYYGPDRKPEALGLGGMRVVLTTYNTMIRDIEKLMTIDWESVVLDEAQYIKTATTQFTRAAKQLNAGTRIALSGTPIENRLDELWSLFDFVLPGYLGSFEQFRKAFEIPIMKDQDGGALARLKKMISPFKLRRVKSEVLADLPAKVEDYRHCELTPHQQALYRAVTDRAGKELIDELKDISANVDYVGVFAALGKLKRVCDHPALVLEGARTKDLVSGKFELFKEVLNEALGSGQKVVVFTQYLEMMDIIEEHLRANRVRFSEIRGNTKDRGEAMREFQTNPDVKVFVCSLLAGGCGIDLTSASVVIHYDRWWNAAKEDQATDRVHRIGQQRGVQVIKLVTRGTLEEKIDKMISAKGALMNSIVDIDAATFRKFSREELIELLTTPVMVKEAEPVSAP
jgi:hypothetical protein